MVPNPRLHAQISEEEGVIKALYHHLLVVPPYRVHVGVRPHVVDYIGRSWASVYEIAQHHDSILIPHVEPLDECLQRTEVSVYIPYDPYVRALVQCSLKLLFQGPIPHSGRPHLVGLLLSAVDFSSTLSGPPDRADSPRSG